VLRAYEEWGDEVVEKLLGEYVMAVWDARRRRLFLGRDAVGVRHLYWEARSGWLMFGSEQRSLRASGRSRFRLNEGLLWECLLGSEGTEDSERTLALDVRRLGPGMAMAAEEGGVRSWRHWRPERLAALRISGSGEAAEGFRARFEAAVGRRLRTRGEVGAMLSGGLDSSSIAGWLGARQRRRFPEGLRTYSFLGESEDRCPDARYVREVLRAGWFRPTVVKPCDGEADRAGYRAFARSGDDVFEGLYGMTYRMMFQRAARDGVKVMLEGIAADLLLGSPSAALALLLRRGQLVEFVKEGMARRPQGGMRAWLGAWGGGLAAALPRGGSVTPPVVQRARARGRAAKRMIRGEFCERMLRRGGPERGGVPGSNVEMSARLWTSELACRAFETYGLIAAREGVEMAGPFADRELVEYAIRLPLEYKLWRPSYKWLQREAMGDVLPEEVRKRERYGQSGWRFHLWQARHWRADFPTLPGRLGRLEEYVDPGEVGRCATRFAEAGEYRDGLMLFRLDVLAEWCAGVETNVGLAVSPEIR
jgi:asparagine synthase (glutamine-hydrolysing)